MRSTISPCQQQHESVFQEEVEATVAHRADVIGGFVSLVCGCVCVLVVVRLHSFKENVKGGCRVQSESGRRRVGESAASGASGRTTQNQHKRVTREKEKQKVNLEKEIKN